MKIRSLSFDPWILFFLLTAAVLLFTRLDNGRLWQDEAETAVLGKNILTFGYPRAFDGINRLNPSLTVKENYAWTYHSWLPMYLAAGSFALFGTDTWAARVPFALMGLISIWLAYLLSKRLTSDTLTARLTTLSLVLCVPFLLHMRQCRYYAPAALFTLWAILAYWRFLHKKSLSSVEFAAALTLLFHSDHGIFVPLLAGCALHFLAKNREKDRWSRGLAVLIPLAALTLPWIIYLDPGQHHKGFSWKEISHHFQFYIRQTNKFLVPIFFWIILRLAWRGPFRSLPENSSGNTRQGWRLTALIIAAGFAFLVLVPEQRHFRYIIFLVPLLLMVQAALLARLIRAKIATGIILAGALLLTDAIHHSGLALLGAQIPAIRSRLSSPKVRIRSLPAEFLGELTHAYRGPIDGIVELLQKESRAGQTIKAPYEEHPLIFYTSLAVEQVRNERDFRNETFPDWIILRRDWIPNEFFKSPYYAEIKHRYKELVLDAPDIPWQNRPDPGYHRFLTDGQAPPVTVLKKEH